MNVLFLVDPMDLHARIVVQNLLCDKLEKRIQYDFANQATGFLHDIILGVQPNTVAPKFSIIRSKHFASTGTIRSAQLNEFINKHFKEQPCL